VLFSVEISIGDQSGKIGSAGWIFAWDRPFPFLLLKKTGIFRQLDDGPDIIADVPRKQFIISFLDSMQFCVGEPREWRVSGWSSEVSISSPTFV